MACREDDTDALRFLWWSAGLDKPSCDYKMTVHLFGKEDSSCIGAWALKGLLQTTRLPLEKESVKLSRKISMWMMVCSQSCRPNRQCIDHWN